MEGEQSAKCFLPQAGKVRACCEARLNRMACSAPDVALELPADLGV